MTWIAGQGDRFDAGGLKMVFISLGNHHDFAVTEVTGEGSSRAECVVGLPHVAFEIATTRDELREARATPDAAGFSTVPIDHDVTKSPYLSDPDGNGVEFCVDVSDAWQRDPQHGASPCSPRVTDCRTRHRPAPRARPDRDS